MKVTKELLTIMVAAMVGGLIIGYGIWGKKQGQEIQNYSGVVDKIEESNNALEALAREMQSLRAELEKTKESKNTVDVLSREMQSVKKILQKAEEKRNAAQEISREMHSLRKELRRVKKNIGVSKKIYVKSQQKSEKTDPAATDNVINEKDVLGYLEFDYGSFTINEENTKKLDALTKTLNEKPGMNIAIEGYVDIERDKEAIRMHRFHEKLKTQKLQDLKKRGSPPASISEIVINPDEYDRYLKIIYKNETFPKPRNLLGIPKSLPASQMQELILSHIEITKDDLRLFASQRSLSVKDHITNTRGLEPRKIRIVETQTLSPEKKVNGKDSVVIIKWIN